MRKISGELYALSARLGNSDSNARIARRAAEVHAMLKDALEHVYRENAPYVLDHVNAVYIKNEKKPGCREGEGNYKALYIYMDDGNYRSDVHSQQHFILLWLKERYGEDIDVFKTLPSRMGMKERHPYAQIAAHAREKQGRLPSVPLNAEEMEEVRAQGDLIEDPRLKEAFIKASTTDKEWKKGERKFS